MHTHIAKWGASCAIRLPKMAVETLGLHEGQSVNIIIQDDSVILKKSPPLYTLQELVAQMDGCNQPELMLDDNPQGEEIL